MGVFWLNSPSWPSILGFRFADEKLPKSSLVSAKVWKGTPNITAAYHGGSFLTPKLQNKCISNHFSYKILLLQLLLVDQGHPASPPALWHLSPRCQSMNAVLYRCTA